MFDVSGNKKKFHEAESVWVRSFDLRPIKCLIVCRGPVRKEAMDIFDEIGISAYGILLSEKDSVVYSMTYAPELRNFRFPENIHRVPDYAGAGKEEKDERIHQIISIAKDNGYTHIFAGYGFMAEDSDFIEAIENAGITFMGPGSHVAKQAGAKDAAKKIARSIPISVTPGEDYVSAKALLRKAGNSKAGLEAKAKEFGLSFSWKGGASQEELIENSEALLQKAYEKQIDIISITDLQEQAEIECQEIWKKFAGKRIRFKYIGGGGGKGQRVISKQEEIRSAVMEVLAESKVTGTGSNRNFLIELNIENTRHNEIQLIGNGDWAVSLGGRDCSLQMHEQKLLEISFTKEMMEQEIASGNYSQKAKEILKGDLQCLVEMEEQSEKFGKAVSLDNVSTFESIVEGTNHFFMEMNTRIQVEHRVTEMAYRLKFTNPKDPKDCFIVESLIEAMALISLYKKNVPKPERQLRNISGAEVRINATNQSLQPHAGGLIQNWSLPIEHEIRDDQGIGAINPDTGQFVHYRLAGAYDSNIALLVSYGNSRSENLERLSEILRVTELRGLDLQSNIPVHYGLINWILGKNVMFKPSTRFMVPYLAGVGALAGEIHNIDLEAGWKESLATLVKKDPAPAKVLSMKHTLMIKPMGRLFASPHLLAGFIGFHHNHSWEVKGKDVLWKKNPLILLSDLYHYLNLDRIQGKPASEMIWEHDHAILKEGLSFYKDLEEKSGINKNFEFWDKQLNSGENPASGKISDELWKKCIEAHKGFQIGLDFLKIIPRVGVRSGFANLDLNMDTLDAVIPAEFDDPAKRDAFIKLLNPPPKAKSDEIVAPMGGMFYSREAPNLPQLLKEGDEFKVGQPLFIIEVMKMFNKIVAPFSGKVVKNLLADSDGKIVVKGQAIFKVQPDEIVKEETEEEISTRRKKVTKSYLE